MGLSVWALKPCAWHSPIVPCPPVGRPVRLAQVGQDGAGGTKAPEGARAAVPVAAVRRAGRRPSSIALASAALVATTAPPASELAIALAAARWTAATGGADRGSTRGAAWAGVGEGRRGSSVQRGDEARGEEVEALRGELRAAVAAAKQTHAQLLEADARRAALRAEASHLADAAAGAVEAVVNESRDWAEEARKDHPDQAAHIDFLASTVAACGHETLGIGGPPGGVGGSAPGGGCDASDAAACGAAHVPQCRARAAEMATICSDAMLGYARRRARRAAEKAAELEHTLSVLQGEHAASLEKVAKLKETREELRATEEVVAAQRALLRRFSSSAHTVCSRCAARSGQPGQPCSQPSSPVGSQVEADELNAKGGAGLPVRGLGAVAARLDSSHLPLPMQRVPRLARSRARGSREAPPRAVRPRAAAGEAGGAAGRGKRRGEGRGSPSAERRGARGGAAAANRRRAAERHLQRGGRRGAASADGPTPRAAFHTVLEARLPVALYS